MSFYPYLKTTNRSSHFVLPMLAPQQYAYLWKAQIKTSPKVGRPSKIMAIEGQESLFLILAFACYSWTISDRIIPVQQPRRV